MSDDLYLEHAKVEHACGNIWIRSPGPPEAYLHRDGQWRPSRVQGTTYTGLFPTCDAATAALAAARERAKQPVETESPLEAGSLTKERPTEPGWYLQCWTLKVGECYVRRIVRSGEKLMAMTVASNGELLESALDNYTDDSYWVRIDTAVPPGSPHAGAHAGENPKLEGTSQDSRAAGSIKLVVGGSYKTRDGNRVEITEECQDGTFTGMVFEPVERYWNIDGTYYCDASCPRTIIGPWSEPAAETWNRDVAELEHAVAQYPGYPSIAANLDSWKRIQKKLQAESAGRVEQLERELKHSIETGERLDKQVGDLERELAMWRADRDLAAKMRDQHYQARVAAEQALAACQAASPIRDERISSLTKDAREQTERAEEAEQEGAALAGRVLELTEEGDRLQRDLLVCQVGNLRLLSEIGDRADALTARAAQAIEERDRLKKESKDWRWTVQECERALGMEGTADSGLTSNLPNVVRDCRVARDTATARAEAAEANASAMQKVLYHLTYTCESPPRLPTGYVYQEREDAVAILKKLNPGKPLLDELDGLRKRVQSLDHDMTLETKRANDSNQACYDLRIENVRLTAEVDRLAKELQATVERRDSLYSDRAKLRESHASLFRSKERMRQALEVYARFDFYHFLISPTGQQTDPTKRAIEALAATAPSPAVAPPAGPERIVEIIGPDGIVHYRRPPGDPMITEAEATQGYTVREVPAANPKEQG